MVDVVRNYLRGLTEPFGGIWSWYGGLDPEQQKSALLLLAIGVGGLFIWIMYQAHGDRVVVVLPAGILRITLLLLVLPFVLLGKAAGRGRSAPEFLLRSWTAEPDPEEARIVLRTVNPMKLPGKPWERLPARARTDGTTRERKQD